MADVKYFRVLKGIIYKGFAYKPFGLIVETPNPNDTAYMNLLKFVTDDEADEGEFALIKELTKGAELKLKKVDIASIHAPAGSSGEATVAVRKLQDMYLTKAEEKAKKEKLLDDNGLAARIAELNNIERSRKRGEVEEI